MNTSGSTLNTEPEYREEEGAAVMAEDVIIFRVDLGSGDCTETVWTSDLSHEHIRINAEYRTCFVCS